MREGSGGGRGRRLAVVAGVAALLPLAPGVAGAQQPAAATVCGRVVHAQTGAPLADVVVRGERDAGGTLTDESGEFCLSGVEPGLVRVQAQRVGLAGAAGEVRVGAGGVARVELVMADRAIEVPGVAVTAREGAGGAEGSTTSRIERAAIEHLQASSLAELLQLLPGQPATNPSFASEGQSLLRQVPTNANAARANALGTAVIVDGAPLSNNANLQGDVTILNSAPGALPPFSSVAGRGVDLRQISPDQIESVEVIRGVPAARHGDLTAGAILVETRVGARRPESRLRMNPTLLDASFTGGWGDGVERSGWSVGGTLAGAQDDPRQTIDNFYRGTLDLAWRSPALAGGRGAATVRAALLSTLDETRQDPDDARYQRERFARERGGRVTLSGWWSPGGGPARLSLTANAAAAHQVGYYQELLARHGPTPLSPATRDTTREGIYGPTEYLNRTTVDGRPLSLYARAEATTRRSLGGWLHRPAAGLEWRYDANRGEGRQFDPLTPPRQNFSVGDRPRSFREVPALRIASLYAEDRVSGRLAGRRAEARLGVRWDNINPLSPGSGEFGTVLQPRLQGSLEPWDGARVHAAWGRTAKAPPLAYLHPGPRYWDLINLNYYAPDPAERLLIVTTRVVEPSNRGARAYAADKAEAGLAWSRGGVDATLTGFVERTSGAYGWRRQVAALPLQRFEILERPAGRPPVIRPAQVDTFIGAYDAPDATRRIDSRGVEFTLDLPEWAALRTSLSLSGGRTRSRAGDDAPTINTAAFLSSGTRPPPRVGIYPTEGREGDRLLTAARLIHRVPEVGLVVSGLVQTLWWDRDRWIDVAEHPVGYVDREGRTAWISSERARSEEFRDLLRPVAPAYLVEERRPPLWLVNLRLAKALPAGLQMAFFVNNALAHRPLYLSRRSEAFEQRNQPLFFGLEMVSRIGG
jgi:hypothetical protein